MFIIAPSHANIYHCLYTKDVYLQKSTIKLFSQLFFYLPFTNLKVQGAAP